MQTRRAPHVNRKRQQQHSIINSRCGREHRSSAFIRIQHHVISQVCIQHPRKLQHAECSMFVCFSCLSTSSERIHAILMLIPMCCSAAWAMASCISYYCVPGDIKCHTVWAGRCPPAFLPKGDGQRPSKGVPCSRPLM